MKTTKMTLAKYHRKDVQMSVLPWPTKGTTLLDAGGDEETQHAYHASLGTSSQQWANKCIVLLDVHQKPRESHLAKSASNKTAFVLTWSSVGTAKKKHGTGNRGSEIVDLVDQGVRATRSRRTVLYSPRPGSGSSEALKGQGRSLGAPQRNDGV